MRKQLSRIAYFFVWCCGSIVLVGTQSGCLIAAAAGGASAGVLYVRGDTETTVNGDPKTVAQATRAAAQEMDLVVISDQATALDGKIIARTATDKKVTVVIKAAGSDHSSISIRVGNFGDDILQHSLLEKIRARLPQTPDATASTAPSTQPKEVAAGS